MTVHRFTLPAAGAALAIIAAAAPAHAQPAPAPAVQAGQPAGFVRLYPDTPLVLRDRISVEVVGKGPDIVLIPGLASSRETWRATAEQLRGRFRLHIVNVAGFAGEPARGNKEGPVALPTAEAIDSYIVSARLNRPMVIGHSLGGTMALWLAETHPDHVSRVLIVDALPFYGVLIGGPTATPDSLRPMAEAMRTRMMAATGGDYRQSGRPMIQAMVTAPANVDRVLDWGAASDPSVVARAMAEDITWDLRPGLAKLTTPITLLYPDTYGPAANAQMADAIYAREYASAPTVKRVRIDNSRHFIMFDQPQRLAAEVEAFVTAGR